MPLDTFVTCVFSILSSIFNSFFSHIATLCFISVAIFLLPITPIRKSSAYLTYLQFIFSVSCGSMRGTLSLYFSFFLPALRSLWGSLFIFLYFVPLLYSLMSVSMYLSNSCKYTFDSSGLRMPPCGVPSSGMYLPSFLVNTRAFNPSRINLVIMGSLTLLLMSFINISWFTVGK